MTFLLSRRTNTPSEIDAVLSEIKSDLILTQKNNQKKQYYNVPCAFDIETSSFYADGKKQACMYVWQFGINGRVIIGRTWDQFVDMMDHIADVLNTGNGVYLICYVHNLAYEFQFFRKWFTWSKVFAIKNRTPVYALTDTGIEFRCSYILSGYSLLKLSDQLLTYKVRKLTGNLDYTKMRHNQTPLTKRELDYCINDILVVMAYIQEKIEQDGSIDKIQLTKTSYVRKYCRMHCFYKDGKKSKHDLQSLRFHEFIKSLTLEPDEYKSLKRAFAGGFTHASGFHADMIVNDVTSLDFTSAYPYAMIAYQFPMTKGEKISIKSKKEFYRNIKYYACVFDVEFYDIDETFIYDHYISSYKCFIKEDCRSDNGRVIRAKRIKLTITSEDFMIIKKTYKWKKMTISNFYRYGKAYLPTDLVRSIVTFYKNKTKLKGVSGKEAEYLSSKENVNSIYGMMVTDIVRDELPYDDDWCDPVSADVESEIAKYNSQYNRFLFYPWGVFVTAYCRKNLWSAILEYGPDYVYSDTDSVKGINYEKHLKYVQKYNDQVITRLKKACKHHGIPFEDVEPLTVKGEKKTLGVWDYDGNYRYFKTLGAKRYMVKYSSDPQNGSMKNKISLTVSGLNKKTVIPWMRKKYRKHITMFDAFRHDMDVPAEQTGKMTHTYIDEPCDGILTDYRGNTAEYHERTYIHLESAPYSLSLSQEYIEYIMGLEELT